MPVQIPCAAKGSQFIDVAADGTVSIKLDELIVAVFSNVYPATVNTMFDRIGHVHAVTSVATVAGVTGCGTVSPVAGCGTVSPVAGCGTVSPVGVSPVGGCAP